jgi:hypothetical protein
MARRVKWADPALRREREGARVREREKERTRARGDAHARRERERKKEHARVGDARAREAREREGTRVQERSERSERGREDTRARRRERERENTREWEARARERRERERAAPAQQRQQWGLRHNSGSSGDFVGVDWSAGATPQARRVSTRWMYLLDCGPQRDGAGELLPAPALFAEAPDRRLAKGGGMREFTTRFSTARASVRMRFKEMAPFFFPST